MNAPILDFTERVIFSLKSGRSLPQTLKEFEERQPMFLEKNQIILKDNEQFIVSSPMTYELNLILNRGLEGLPIINSLESFHDRLYEKIDFLIEEKTKKAPFTALIPLFIFQVPSLCLVFFYPLINEFLREAL